MYSVGVLPGKFLPPHRGHLSSILHAATQCRTLYVVVSDRKDYTERVCRENGLRPMPMKLRARWLSQELQGFDHIRVLTLDEGDIPEYPEGTEPWSKLLTALIPEKIDIIFGGDAAYRDTYMKFFPGVVYGFEDRRTTRFRISATEIRSNPLRYWDYILGSARSHFALRVLITGTESCGKSVLTRALGKLYHTSWTEEAGRTYSARRLGGNEDVFEPRDFIEIAHEQSQLDDQALRTANRIAFFDTDAVVTQYYAALYGPFSTPSIESFVDPDKYDLVLFLSPDVPWVPDGLRWLQEQNKREELDATLFSMYLRRGFDRSKIVKITGDYRQRLLRAESEVDKLLSRAETKERE